MGKQIAGPFLCETDNLSNPISSNETLTVIGLAQVSFSSDQDVEELQVGSIIILDNEPGVEYRIIELNARIKDATVHQDIGGPGGTTSFTYWRLPLAVRWREEDGSGGYHEHLQSYIKEDGTYHVDEQSQSGCLLSGKNTASQSLTADTRTLLNWDNALIWTNPKNEWTNNGVDPNFFVPIESGYYSIWASFSLFATSSTVGDQVTAEVSIDGWADSYITIVHQRPDLDFVSTWRRNIDLQCFVLVAAEQKLGVYITSECNTSEVSNIYTAHFAAWRLGDSFAFAPATAKDGLKKISGKKPELFRQ